MSKLKFLAICMFSFIAFSSCTKEAIQNNNNTTPVYNSPAVTVSASSWMPSSMLVWQETEVDGIPAIEAMVSAQLTESMINNNTVLVYARKADNEAIAVFPATLYDSNNDYELLHSE